MGARRNKAERIVRSIKTTLFSHKNMCLHEGISYDWPLEKNHYELLKMTTLEGRKYHEEVYKEKRRNYAKTY